MRIRWKALIPLLGVLGTWLASPHALALVSDRHSHILLAASSLIAVLTPALLTNRPKTSRPARQATRKLEERLQKAGLDDGLPQRQPIFRPPTDSPHSQE